MRGRRSEALRSMISASATIEAMMSGQIGQPMACTIANKSDVLPVIQVEGS
jgi:hypothetical protein